MRPRLDKFTHCFDCRKEIDLAYGDYRSGIVRGLCYECKYDIEALNKIVKAIRNA